MKVTKDISKSAVEVLEILNYCSDDVLNKIPKEFINYLKDIQSFDYVFEYDKTKKLEDQNLLPQTYYFMGLIYKDYICDENERTDYMEELKKFKQDENNIKYEKYPIDKLFESTNKNLNEVDKEKSMVKYEKTNWLKKLFNKVKEMLRGTKKGGF